MSIDAEMLQVIVFLLRAEERAIAFGRSPEQIAKINLLRRAAAKVRSELCAKAARN
jgi:hypothetical protein